MRIVLLASHQRRIVVPCSELEENVGALNVHLAPDDLKRLDELAIHKAVAGERYPAEAMKTINR